MPTFFSGTIDSIAQGEPARRINNNLITTEIANMTFKDTLPVTCFCGPDNAYEVIMSSLEEAEESFYLEVYTLSSEPLVNALIAAYDRGVDVMVSLSHLRVNNYENQYTEEAAYRLDQAGVIVYWMSSEFAYTHAKFWIVDQQVAYVYSGNWAPSSIPQSPEARTNREMGLAFNNSVIADHYMGVFIDDQLNGELYESQPGVGYLQDNETSGTYEHPFDPVTITEYVEVTPVFSNDNSYALLSQLIQSANESIDVELQYIKDDCDLLFDLLDAADRGVSVRVLIPEPSASNENVTQTLFDHGISVKFFKGMYNHNKYICVDGKIVSISSINWSDNSLYNNREAGANVMNENIAAYFTTIFEYDWDKSETPAGSGQPVTLVSPQNSAVISGTHTFTASFTDANYTSGELLIDSTSVQTWNEPSGTVTFDVDTTTYDNGIHNVTLIATPDGESPIQIDVAVNIVNTAEWKLLISEVRFDAVTEPNGEFFEIYNGFDFDLVLGDWVITDNEDVYTFPDETFIGDKEVLIFSRDETAFTTEMADIGITGVTVDVIYGDIAFGNSGDELILQDSSSTVYDAVVWGSGSHSGVVAFSGSVDEDESIQRVPATQDTDDCSVDFIINTPTPGTVNITTSTPPTETTTPTETSTEETESSGLFPGLGLGITILGIVSLATFVTLLLKKRK
jgi:hypothetical protein